MNRSLPRDSGEADRLLTELQAVLRCRCCPDGVFTGLFGARNPAQETAPRRALTREDFIGLLGPHELDRGAR